MSDTSVVQPILIGAVTVITTLIGVIYAHLLSKFKDSEKARTAIQTDVDKLEVKVTDYVKDLYAEIDKKEISIRTSLKDTAASVTLSSRCEDIQDKWQLRFDAIQAKSTEQFNRLADNMLLITEELKEVKDCIKSIIQEQPCK